MKKKVLVLLMAGVLAVVMLTSCGGGGLSGKYTVTSITSGTTTINADQLASAGYAKDSMYLNFNSNGTFDMAFTTVKGSGKYSVSGKTVTLNDGTDKITGTIDGNKITLDFTPIGENVKVVFEKS